MNILRIFVGSKSMTVRSFGWGAGPSVGGGGGGSGGGGGLVTSTWPPSTMTWAGLSVPPTGSRAASAWALFSAFTAESFGSLGPPRVKEIMRVTACVIFWICCIVARSAVPTSLVLCWADLRNSFIAPTTAWLGAPPPLPALPVVVGVRLDLDFLVVNPKAAAAFLAASPIPVLTLTLEFAAALPAARMGAARRDPAFFAACSSCLKNPPPNCRSNLRCDAASRFSEASKSIRWLMVGFAM